MESHPSTGRYAPSPSGPLHVGNLRTALIAWAWARYLGGRFLLRIEDIDPGRTGAADRQILELESLGIDWDEAPLYQSRRLALYEDALTDLARRDLLFECYCSRKDIREAARAPHSPPGHYPGTCRYLTDAQREARREELASLGRMPALRLAPQTEAWTISDELHGSYTASIDAFVLRRSDGGPAYNLAVVVDDALSAITHVVRGDDLLSTAPGQAYLTTLLGTPAPVYGHVPLVLNREGKRLAKRDGAVTLEDLEGLGWAVGDVVQMIAASVGVVGARTAAELLEGFRPALIPHAPFQFSPESGLIPR